MLALEGIYKDGQVTLTEPASKINKTTKVVVLFMEEQESDDPTGIELAKLQGSTGFSQNILANPAEDIWNEL